MSRTASSLGKAEQHRVSSVNAASSVPLHVWTPGGTGISMVTRVPARALVRIEDKLRGIMRKREPLSYKGQVGALLREARSGENLCQMFDGWAAWL